MRYATTFSGIGGWELGLNACGWELAWQCEREPFCQALLAERFGVPICPDINILIEWLIQQFGSIEAASVDVLVGSPPCQPFSVAGEKRGDSDERHLYPQFIRAAGILKPRWVLMENVPGLLSNRRVFGAYIGGLAALGYDIVWHCIPASAVGANHQRDRIWIIANAHSGRPHAKQKQKSGVEDSIVFNRNGQIRDVADANNPPSQRFGQHGGEVLPNKEAVRFGCGSPLHASDPTRKLPYESRKTRNWRRQSSNGCWWSSEPDVGRVAHGVPYRVDRLKGLGNAVVPQIPFLIGQAINEIEGLTCSNPNQPSPLKTA